MTSDKRFKELKDHLRLASSMVEKLISGEANIEYCDIKSFLEFQVGCALIEVFKLTKENPCGTLGWILERLTKERRNDRP